MSEINIESKKISVLLGASGSGKTLTSLAFSNNLPKNLTKIGGEISILDSSSNKEPKFFYIIQNQIASFMGYSLQEHRRRSRTEYG